MAITDLTKSKQQNNLIKIVAIGAGLLIANNILKKIGADPGALIGNPFGGVGQSVPERPGCVISTFRKIQLEKIADDIYTAVLGANFKYYPEKSDKIIPLDDCELFYTHDYYAANHGETLYQALDGEMDFGVYYGAAKDRLTAAGLNI